MWYLVRDAQKLVIRDLRKKNLQVHMWLKDTRDASERNNKFCTTVSVVFPHALLIFSPSLFSFLACFTTGLTQTEIFFSLL